MTVQELIDELNKVEDKLKPVYQLDSGDVNEVEANNSSVAIWYNII